MNSARLTDRKVRQNPRQFAFYNNPYAFYQRLHSIGGPVFWEDYGFWCISEFDSVDSVLKDKRFARLPPAQIEVEGYPEHLNDFAKSERFSLLALEPPDHTRLRQKLNKAFVSRQVQAMSTEIHTLARERIDSFRDNREVELLASYATPIPVTVIARLLGVPESECDNLLEWSHRMVSVYTMTQSLEDELAANKAAKEFQHLLKDLIKQRRKQPSDDLITHLTTSDANHDSLSDEEISCLSILLLNAGHEATVHQIGNAVHTLVLHPQDLGWAHDEKRADAIVAEALRFDAPLHLFTRFAQEQIELAPGIILEAGDQVGLLLGAANRDPGRFHNAHLFDPERHDAANVSLGAGIHFCVGALLAKLEIRVALTTLFSELPELRLLETPTYKDSFHFHGLQSLKLGW